ncbi:MAG: DNA polymerase I [Chloroflexi bacterium]|nr:DNA polymerase I [Chloroflexota bacterium]
MKLILLDANALIHRAYHAIPPTLTSPTGEPTNATFGFTSTLLKVLADEKPEFLAAAFDIGAPKRKEKFAAYKAQRPPLPDDLRVQLHRSRDVVDAFGIPTFGIEGFEADDLLGTLARQANEQGVEVVIVTGDSDAFQLVNAQTTVLTFSRQFGETVLYDEAKVRERYQLEPQQLIDFKALKGDASDNIPGVSGIGEKTAAKLLQQFASVENIYAHLDDIEPKLREKLRAGAEQARVGKELVTILTDAPAQLDLEKCRVSEYDRERVVAFFRQMGFRTLIERLPALVQSAPSETVAAPAPTEAAAPASEKYHLVQDAAALDALVAKLKSREAFVIDVETTDTDAMIAELVGIAIGVGDGEAYYIPVASDLASVPPAEGQLALAESSTPYASRFRGLARDLVLAKLKPVLENAVIKKFAHNIKYDATVLAQAGVEMRALAFDSMIAASLVEPASQSIGLKSLVFTKFGVEMTEIESLIGKGKKRISMAEVEVGQAAPYACADADYTYRLVEHYQPQLSEHGVEELFYKVEMPLVQVLMEIERVGVLLDLEFLKKMSGELAQRLQELEKQIQEIVGAPINIASPQQLGEALFNKLGLSSVGLPKTKTGQISTAADVLEGLRDAHPVIALILEHRELSKLQGTYVEALPALVNPKTGRVHTDYNQTGTVTGRVSSSDPNLQNIPIRTELGRQVRRAFIAPRGSKLISADYSQVELRILAHITRDAGLLDAFARDQDIHAATAAKLYNIPIDQVTADQRRWGKTINFGIAYGITDYGIAARTDLSQKDARALIENYFAQFPRIKEYIETTKREAHERGYVQTLLGRRRYFPELQTTARVHQSARNSAEREAINMPIQGSAADIIKLAMIRLHRELLERKLKSRMTLQVHDELVLECPDAEVNTVAPLVKEIMEGAYTLESRLKVEVSVGQNWEEQEKIQIQNPKFQTPNSNF